MWSWRRRCSTCSPRIKFGAKWRDNEVTVSNLRLSSTCSRTPPTQLALRSNRSPIAGELTRAIFNDGDYYSLSESRNGACGRQVVQGGEQRGRHGWSPCPAAGAAAAAATHGGSLPMPPSRKEWRVVFEHYVRSAGDEELDRMNLVQSEERTMYEHGTGARDVDFCSVTIDGSLNDDVLQQRLQGISRQPEELQHIEIGLRAQLIARVEIMEMQKNFDAKIKEHATANAKLKEQLQLQRWTRLIRIGRIGSSISTSYRSQPSVRWESSRTSTATRRRTPGR